jgi:hypothetical protein
MSDMKPVPEKFVVKPLYYMCASFILGSLFQSTLGSSKVLGILFMLCSLALWFLLILAIPNEFKE